jgi:hypothetical protein
MALIVSQKRITDREGMAHIQSSPGPDTLILSAVTANMTIQNPTSNVHSSSDSLITQLTALGARAYFRELANTDLDGCMQIYSTLTTADTVSKDQRDKAFAALYRAKLLIEADQVEMLSALADSGREIAFEMIMAEYEG